jgi:hypothetical protein
MSSPTSLISTADGPAIRNSAIPSDGTRMQASGHTRLVGLTRSCDRAIPASAASAWCSDMSGQ